MTPVRWVSPANNDDYDSRMTPVRWVSPAVSTLAATAAATLTSSVSTISARDRICTCEYPKPVQKRIVTREKLKNIYILCNHHGTLAILYLYVYHTYLICNRNIV